MTRLMHSWLWPLLLLVFIGVRASAPSAQRSLQALNSPPTGRIFYGPVEGATSPPAAMSVLLRMIHNNCGEKPQVGKVFKVKGTNSNAVFLTVVNHQTGNKQRAGLLIVSPAGPSQMEAGMVVDDADRFGSTVNTMLNTLFSVWRPGGGSLPDGDKPVPPEPLYPAWNQDRSASLAIPAGWKIMGHGGTTSVFEPNYNAILTLNLVRTAANPSYAHPRSMGTGMGALLVFPSNVDLVGALPNLMQEFYRLNNQRLDYRITQVAPIPGPPGQRCVHSFGHGMLFGMNQPPNVQEKDYTEMEALVCVSTPGPPMGNYAVTISTTQIFPQLANRYRATVAAILRSYQVNMAVVTQEANAIAAPAIDAIHQIGKQAADRYAAADRANDAQHAGYWARQDENARTNQGFHNYILDQTVIQENNMYGNGTIGHGTVWNSTADALVKADPNRYEIVNSPNFWQGWDY